ncbi:hypothetical protein CHU32_00925 [Superficieibacter electus]|uniref:Uncharacterized protein n=1 Tax=Superficieibacter electus TaxID=2022662 RepID=A0A2P5GW17_9ENTR|nr:hypothetical protein [Superficieibacter electus]POP47738.1 hypothetical protein CHU33_00925 [Superficieibacter electus]POP50750.1 hypothetical protein CHU32_00925 [Superficieibacter electus]
MMADVLVEETVDVTDTPEFNALLLYQMLNDEQLSEVSLIHNITAISGLKVDAYSVNYYTSGEKLKIQRRMT